MEINIKKEGNAFVVSIKGRMDAASSPEFEKIVVVVRGFTRMQGILSRKNKIVKNIA